MQFLIYISETESAPARKTRGQKPRSIIGRLIKPMNLKKIEFRRNSFASQPAGRFERQENELPSRE
jgi:hypothetical protein